jgi:hypothetical protein
LWSEANLGFPPRCPSAIGCFMTETQRPNLVTNPADDVAFRHGAEAALQEGQSVAELQVLLRQDFPRAVVRPRELDSERLVVWYVYSDGR